MESTAFDIMRLVTSHIPIGRTPGFLSSAIRRQARKGAIPQGSTREVHSLLARAAMDLQSSTDAVWKEVHSRLQPLAPILEGPAEPSVCSTALFFVNCSMLTAQCSICQLHNALCQLHNAQYVNCTMLYMSTAQCSMSTAQCSMSTAQCSMSTAQCSMSTAQCSMSTAQCSMLTAQCSMSSALFCDL